MRSIRLKLASTADVKRIIDCVRGTVILHDFLLSDEDWLQVTTEEETSDDLEPEPTTASNQPDHSRRDELCFHLSELMDTAIN